MNDPFPSLTNRILLLVGDDGLNALLTKENLMKDGVDLDVVHVKNGAEAMAYLLKQGDNAGVPTPLLILLDLDLPGLNGYELLSFIGLNPHLKTIPVIVVTGEEDGPALMEQFGLPMHMVFTKWIHMQDFISVVKAVVDVDRKHLSLAGVP